MVPGTAYSRSGGMDRFAEACAERPREMSSMNFNFVHIVSMSDFLNCRSSCSFNWHVEEAEDHPQAYCCESKVASGAQDKQRWIWLESK